MRRWPLLYFVAVAAGCGGRLEPDVAADSSTADSATESGATSCIPGERSCYLTTVCKDVRCNVCSWCTSDGRWGEPDGDDCQERPAFARYVERRAQRPALMRTEAQNVDFTIKMRG